MWLVASVNNFTVFDIPLLFIGWAPPHTRTRYKILEPAERQGQVLNGNIISLGTTPVD